MYRSWKPLFAVSMVALSLAACESVTTSPELAFEPGASALLGMTVEEKAAKEAEEKRKERLDTRVEEEKQRIKQAKEASREHEKALKEEWKAWKKQWNEARKQAKKEGRVLSVDLMRCEPQSYDAETKIIGPDGGDIKMGPHKLIIPKGALQEEVVITGEAPVTDLVAVQFSPHGLVFKRSPILELDYKHCFVPNNDPTRHQIVYVDSQENILEYLISADNKHWHEVLAEIDHFSKYALAIP